MSAWPPDWRHEWVRFRFMRRGTTPTMTGITPGAIRNAMDELRAVDPEAAMLLGEWVVLDDPTKLPRYYGPPFLDWKKRKRWNDDD